MAERFPISDGGKSPTRTEGMRFSIGGCCGGREETEEGMRA